MALDIDGTLTGVGSNDISPAVKAAITRVTDHGVKVVLSTGRSLVGVTPIAAQLPVSFALCSNGAVWWDPATREIPKRTTFDPGPAVEKLRALLPGSVFAVERTGVGNLSLGRFLPGDLWGETVDATFDEIAATPTPRLVLRWLDRTPAELAFAVKDLHLPGVEWTTDHTEAWLTVVPADVTKGSALHDLSGELGIDPRDALAIGDGSNDVEMLRWAGHGVAMGQAPAHVQAVADEVCPTVLDDGAAQVLDRFFPA
ncbi:HAD-superfamily hydrolase, subfamily IIB [Lentzea fradiae]|uniref:HAD-superfamily hydrolase, subfamily IIB n=1 Tax=Lentzea fradiae TaxID=200378 RepID=A0A1G7M2G0_9PSEU|nr:HAD-superfamily hydrolase, subfamily IIB [Lentzea fradiae]